MLADLGNAQENDVDVALRPPATVMRLKRLGSFFPTRLSFMPTLIRRLQAERWSIEVSRNALDGEGYGHIVYRARGPERTYSLIAFSQALDAERRTDRVIAEAWDATFALFDGEPADADIDRLARSVPRQEAGRYRATELVLSRANRSVRFFDHVVERLASGQQPDPELTASVGYLMRTTAVYGNGKFGIADRARICARPELAGPFQAEMLTVYLIRCFTLDLVEHIAGHRAPESWVPLDQKAKRRLGIGNATGLGMAPFLVNHPVLINNWILARETALAKARSIAAPKQADWDRFGALLGQARAHVGEWRVEDPHQSARISVLEADLAHLAGSLDEPPFRTPGPRPWDALFQAAERTLSVEAQELLVTLLIELCGPEVDGLTGTMSAQAAVRLEAGMPVARLRQLLQARYDWALAIDFDSREACRRFWYVSEEKLEPRLGERFEEDGADKEMPLAIARDVQALHRILSAFSDDTPLAEVVLVHPQVRHVAARIQTTARRPYGEIRDNLIGAECLPIDLLRCKLSFFGAAKFDPKSDRWTRITMFAGAPLPDELGPDAAEWFVLAPGDQE